MVEHNDHAYKLAQRDVIKLKKQQEEINFINPELAEQHKEKGNEAMKQSDFGTAIDEYTLAIKRNPQNAAYYSNRCAAYIKVMDLGNAQKDAEKGLELDPTFSKLYLRLGNVYNLMKKYHKALEAYDKGLAIDPKNAELQQGKMRTMMSIQNSASGNAHDDKE